MVKRACIKINALSYAKLVAALVNDEHQSIRDLEEHTGLHYGTVREQLCALHAEKLIYISGYNKDSRGRDNERLWTWGRKRDVVRTKMTQSERQARMRAKRKTAELLGLLSRVESCV